MVRHCSWHARSNKDTRIDGFGDCAHEWSGGCGPERAALSYLVKDGMVLPDKGDVMEELSC